MQQLLPVKPGIAAKNFIRAFAGQCHLVVLLDQTAKIEKGCVHIRHARKILHSHRIIQHIGRRGLITLQIGVVKRIESQYLIYIGAVPGRLKGIGLEAAVALKNAYALGVAMTIGLVNRDLGANAGLHYNSQAGAFYQAAREMMQLLEMFKASEDCKIIGIGDLYVTVYGGRTRKVGILLGEGKTYEEAMEILAGVTLESLVVARRVAKAIYKRAETGKVDISRFPMLTHVNDVLDNGKDAHLPWDAFTFDNTK